MYIHNILLYLTILFLFAVVNAHLPYGGKIQEKSSIEETNWVDEKEIRERLSSIAAEKFSHHYHEKQERPVLS
ncbi:hypothetical protein L5515_011502 [Caenorhabditis briggsae]|uniref:Uncharacterized protein n=1 Tax=Caenorhabditis briggsae TaxID=6238 RepID=A0AAE9EUF6_CAEBR|nr:hypothetical protein L5515_011502 [Caenorhabditis briggsae]